MNDFGPISTNFWSKFWKIVFLNEIQNPARSRLKKFCQQATKNFVENFEDLSPCKLTLQSNAKMDSVMPKFVQNRSRIAQNRIELPTPIVFFQFCSNSISILWYNLWIDFEHFGMVRWVGRTFMSITYNTHNWNITLVGWFEDEKFVFCCLQ